MPTTEQERVRLLEQANRLPERPGVYIMKNKAGAVIYVGKSKKLKNRVSQYFQNTERNVKTQRMVYTAASFDYILCDTEIEALSLENTLIKQYQPKYNIRLKDAKSYPYILVTDGEYPVLKVTRSRTATKNGQAVLGTFFGPFSGTSVAYGIVDAVNAVFGLPNCRHRFPAEIGKCRPCLYYHIQKCCGVCTGNVSPGDYRERIALAQEMLRGHTASVRNQIKEKMTDYAEREQYEAAARMRDMLFFLEKLNQKQKVVADPDKYCDVIGFGPSEPEGTREREPRPEAAETGTRTVDSVACLSVFSVRGGAVVDMENVLIGDCILDEETVPSVICRYYEGREYIPPEILLDYEMEENEIAMLGDYLTGWCGHRVVLRTPKRGASRKLCRLATDNATEAVRSAKRRESETESVLSLLSEKLGIDYPERIEAYDVSNFGRECLTCGMIVIENGRFCKSDYRLFRMKETMGIDDYASMTEALSRRLRYLTDDVNGQSGSCFEKRPDLILLDGGHGHVQTVQKVLDAAGLDIPVVGMAKDDYHKTRVLCREGREIDIAREQELYNFIYKIQEEVHRFSISRMKAAKNKQLTTSVLTQIPGIGPKKAMLLLSAFPEMGKLETADTETLAAIQGISERDAANVRAFFDKSIKENRS